MARKTTPDEAVSYTYCPNGVRLSIDRDRGNKFAYAKYSDWRDERNARLRAEAFIDRFVELYGEAPLSGAMIAPGLALWRDYYEWTGDHMILTDEGWEPGEAKQSYISSGNAEAIIDELNAPCA